MSLSELFLTVIRHFAKGVSALFFVMALAFHGPAQAQTTSSQIAPLTQDADVITLEGFRSAEFGMDEDAVLAAIAVDFGIENDAVEVGLNTVERTRVMTVIGADVLRDGGAAQISYIFGYESKNLIQVGVLWSAATDPIITEETLYSNGEILKAFFGSAGYLPETIMQDVVLENGILLFRGSDQSGHTAILLLQGEFQEIDGANVLFPQSLTLLYAVDPDNPDILVIESGDF